MTGEPPDPLRRALVAGSTGTAALALGGGWRAAGAQQPPRGSLNETIGRMLGTGRYVAGIGDSYWAHPQDGVFLPAGVYDAGDIALVGNRSPFPALSLWAIPGSVVIRIPDDRYLFVTGEQLSRIWVFGVTFVGGKGVLDHRHAGTNVNGIFAFEKCIFDGYTECAIANAASDQPYLRVRDCTFMAAKGAAATGIAWGGYADGTIIEGNAFLRNRYHLKLGPGFSGSVHVLRNDFIRWDTAGPFAAAIWLVPQVARDTFGANSGWGTQIAGNKFGNENLTPGDVRILVATEDEGPSRAVRAHADRFVGGGRDGAYLAGVSVRDCLVACNATTASPFMRSYVAEVRNFAYADNRHTGGGHTWLCEFMGSRSGDYADLNWTVSLDPAGSSLFGSPFARGVANAPIGPIHDHAGALGIEEEAILPTAGGDDTSFVPLAAADRPDAFTTYQGTRVVPAPDHAGHPRAALVRVPAANVGIAVPLAGVAAGRLSWAALDLKRAGTASVAAVRVHVRDVRSGREARIARYVLPPEWRRVRIPFTFPADANGGAWQLIVAADDHAADGNGFCVARALVYHGREPMRDGHLRTTGDGGWDGPHLVMGNTHIWQHEGRLRIKTDGAPMRSDDGTPV